MPVVALDDHPYAMPLRIEALKSTSCRPIQEIVPGVCSPRLFVLRIMNSPRMIHRAGNDVCGNTVLLRSGGTAARPSRVAPRWWWMVRELQLPHRAFSILADDSTVRSWKGDSCFIQSIYEQTRRKTTNINAPITIKTNTATPSLPLRQFGQISKTLRHDLHRSPPHFVHS